MKSPRNIEVKGLLNADEYVEFDTERVAANEQTSPLIRRLIKGWTDEQKDKRSRTQREWPGYSQKMAMIMPSRSVRPAFYVRN